MSDPITGPVDAKPLYATPTDALVRWDDPGQTWRRLSGGFGPAGLAAPLDLYVSPSGDDRSGGNAGLDPANPCRTINRALESCYSFDLGGRMATIHLAAGSYVESVFFNQPARGGGNAAPNPNGTNVQPGQIMLSGAGSGTTTLNGAGYGGTIVASNYAVVGLRGLRLLGTGASFQSTLFAQIAGTINLYDDLDFGPATVEHIHIEDQGDVQAWYSYKISGNAVRHITCAHNGNYIHSAFPSGVITFVGTPTFSDAFIWASQSGSIQFNDVSFVGSFIGKRFSATSNGTIYTYPSSSLTWLPGTIAGDATSGGVYVGPLPPVIVGALASGGNGTTHHAAAADLSDAVFNAPWTPALAFGGSSAGITYSTQDGTYSKVGKQIIATFDLILSSKGAQVGAATITGLPFAVNRTIPCLIGYYDAMAAIGAFSAYAGVGGATITLAATGPAGANTSYTNANFTNGTRIGGSISYSAP